MKYLLLWISLAALPATVSGFKTDSNEFLNALFNFGLEASVNNSAAEESYLTESDIYQQDIGIQWHSSVTRRIGDASVDPDSIFSGGKTYYRTGVNWNILEGGWFSNRNKADYLQYQAKIERRLQNQKTNDLAYYKQFLFADYLFNHQLADIYSQRKELLTSKKEIAYELNRDRIIQNEPLIEIRKRLDEAELQLSFYQSSLIRFENQFSRELSNINFKNGLPELTNLPDLQLNELLKDLPSITPGTDLLQLKKRQLDIENSWWADTKLTASLNYNYQVPFTGDARQYSSARLSLRIPISSLTNRNERKDLLSAKIRDLDQLHNNQQEHTRKELMTLYQEYRYKQKQAGDLKYNLQKIEEQLRVHQVIEKSVSTKVSESIHLMNDDRLAVQSELLKVQQDALKILLKINLLVPDTDLRTYLLMSPDTNPALNIALLELEKIQDANWPLIADYLKGSNVRNIILHGYGKRKHELYDFFGGQSFRISFLVHENAERNQSLLDDGFHLMIGSNLLNNDFQFQNGDTIYLGSHNNEEKGYVELNPKPGFIPAFVTIPPSEFYSQF
jgi:hypothetical protein